MSNPYFSNDPYFGDSPNARKQRERLTGQSASGPAGAPYAPSAGNYGSYQQPAGATSTLPPIPDSAPSTVPMEALEHAYAQPSASAYETGRMTYDDVIMKTSLLLGVVVLVGALAWMAPPATQQMLMIVGLIGGFVLGLVNSFRKKVSPPLILAYAAFEGLFLGSISSWFEASWSGIVMQAIIGTLCVFATMLVLFRSGKVRNTPKFQRIVMLSLIGYAVFALVNLVLVWTGVLGGWGMRSGGLGLLIGAVAVVLAAATLVIDFDSIQQGVRRGAPASYAWAAAFGLTVTLVWMYLEILRILAILRGDN